MVNGYTERQETDGARSAYQGPRRRSLGASHIDPMAVYKLSVFILKSTSSVVHTYYMKLVSFIIFNNCPRVRMCLISQMLESTTICRIFCPINMIDTISYI